ARARAGHGGAGTEPTCLDSASNMVDTVSIMEESASGLKPCGSAVSWRPRRLCALEGAHLEQLADVLLDCVEGGASVSFMDPLPRQRAIAFWQGVAASVAKGERALLVAEDALGVCGT